MIIGLLYTLIHLIFAHLIFAHLIFAHLIFAHLIFAHLIFAHLIFAHLIFAHLIFAHLQISQFRAHPIFAHCQKRVKERVEKRGIINIIYDLSFSIIGYNAYLQKRVVLDDWLAFDSFCFAQSYFRAPRNRNISRTSNFRAGLVREK